MQRSDVDVVLYGNRHELRRHLSDENSERLTIRTAQALDADQCDGKAVLVRGRESALFKAVASVANGEADACISAGSSAALVVAGLRLLGRMPGIHRPAICKQFGYENRKTYLLDLGANAECTARNLYEFALLAAELAFLRDGLRKARIGILSNGREAGKGNRHTRQAAQLLARCPGLNFCGYIEADALFACELDIVVCDGFSGNIALKSAEGAANMLLSSLEGLLSDREASALEAVKRQFGPGQHNGAFFLGLNGVVVKSHGSADGGAFLKSLQQACDMVAGDWLSTMNNKPFASE